jgi:hypothetical protein
LDQACKRLLDANKPPAVKQLLIAYGSANFSGCKGGRRAPNLKFKKRLKSCYNDRCVVVDVNEFHTSKICSNCHGELDNVYPFDAVKKTQGTKIWTLKTCNVCQLVWNRDVNAARNMGALFLHESSHKGERPPAFSNNYKPCGQVNRILPLP